MNYHTEDFTPDETAWLSDCILGDTESRWLFWQVH